MSFLNPYKIFLGLCIVSIICTSCTKEPSQFDRYEEATFLELIEKGSEFDGLSVSVAGLLSSNTSATILESVEELPYTFDELGVPWISIEDPNWDFRQPMVPRLVRIFGDYEKYSMEQPTLGRLKNIRLIEMSGIKEQFLLPHQKEGDDPNAPFR